MQDKYVDIHVQLVLFLQRIYANMQLIYVNMQTIYVDIQLNYGYKMHVNHNKVIFTFLSRMST